MPTFRDDLIAEADYFFDGKYDVVPGRVIPSVSDVPFGRSGKEVELAMLFIDVKESTKIVNAFRLETAARMYQTFLRGVTRITLKNDGEVRSFNGDGVLVTFYGVDKCDNAVRSALQMMDFFKNVLKQKMSSYIARNKQLNDFVFDCGIGIDLGNILVVRGGTKGEDNNDLVWVGNATNYAVKLASQAKLTPASNLGALPSAVVYNIHITNRVHSQLSSELKYIKGGIFLTPTNIWNRQPSLLKSSLPSSLATTTIYRTNRILPF